MEPTVNHFTTLAKVNVNEKIEKKNGLSYLSWAWAVDQLLRHDPAATWSFAEPVRWGETVMVFCTVTAFGKPMTMQLPVMDHRNKAIPNPDAFAVNTAMMRCLTKAISLHGLGLYIYAGEDLPPDESGQPAEPEPIGQTVEPLITKDQLSEIAAASLDYRPSKVVSKALKHYEVKDPQDLTAKQAAIIIKRIHEEQQAAASAAVTTNA